MSINKFAVMKETAERIIEEKKKAHYEAEEVAKKASKAYEEAEIELRKLEGIEKMAGWNSNEPYATVPYEWYLYNEQENLNDYVWKKCFRLKTNEFEFFVTIKESSKLKKWKYIVNVSGNHSTPSRHTWQGGYSDYDYLKRKYHEWVSGGWVGSTFHQSYYRAPEGLEFEKKFTKLEDAQKHVDLWKDKLEADHLYHIMKGRELIKIIKASK